MGRFDEKPDWPDITSITSFRSWRYNHHVSKAAEVAECSENGLPMKVKHIYYWPGDHISITCKVCQRYIHRGFQGGEVAECSENGLPMKSEINTSSKEFDGSGNSDSSYMPGNRIVPTRHGFLPHIRRQTFEQIGNTLHIHNAEAKAAGVYFCYDDAAINLVRYFYILHAMTPINEVKRIL
ncbi:unnamed protein product, partial [Mesorhabditis belari]|uniref:Uncharacterized protein n=1 Tax=Mesorhabditis belari TaxID=2138241 RepID=A0AAF3FM32_9BILA